MAIAIADHPLILYRDLARDAVLTASSELTPVARVQEMRPSRKWRAAAPDGAAWLLIDHGAPVTRTHVYVLAHDLESGGTIRVRTGDDPTFAAVETDITREAWEPVAGFGFDTFGQRLGGYPDLSGFNDYRPYKVIGHGRAVTNRYTRVDFQQVVASSVEVGRVFDGLGHQFGRGMSYGWSLEWADPSEVTETETSLAVRRRTKYRVLQLGFEHLDAAEAMTALDDLKRILGASRDCLIQLFPAADEGTAYRTTVYGLPQRTAPVSNPFFNAYSTTQTIRELPA